MQVNQENVQLLLATKHKMQYSLFGLLGIFLLVFFIESQFGGINIIAYIFAVLAPTLWLITLFFIFRVNYLVNSLFSALFRVVISIIPIFMFYVVYRSSYDTNVYIKR
ncbi:hypothetical protein [Psychromonas sp. SP041]|uniref:hypothetical protein n=1 Tax=Psychromonas sp. SP041 TaxID=1365007 RepID=UPI0004104902|nr:hypothetical protein [Psychromonas sp. SP041]